MSDAVDAADLLDVLSRRHELLAVLSERPQERHELVDAVSDAKSTVYKGVTQLLDLGLVEQTADGLRPTAFGTVALRRYEELAATGDLAPVLSGLPSDAVDPSVVVGGEFVSPDASAVDRHLLRARDELAAATEIRGVAPAASARNIATIGNRAVAGDLTAEFVLTGDLLDRLRRDGSDAVQSLVDAGVTLWQTGEPVPFGVCVFRDGEAARMAIEFRDGSLVTGLLLNDTAESVRWAERQVARYRDDATPVGPSH